MWTETPQMVYTAIYIHGGQEAIGSAKGCLEAAGFRLAPTGSHSLLLENTLSEDYAEVKAVADKHGLALDVLGEREVTTRKATPKPFKLNLVAGKWYWADNLEDVTPLIFVRDVSATAEAQLLTLEYLAPTGMPVPVTVDSREVVEYGFRPATVEDFERYDIPAPDHTYLVPKTAKVEEINPAKPKAANVENFKRNQEKVMEKTALRKLDREADRDLLTEAKEALSVALAAIEDVQEYGRSSDILEEALYHLYAASKIVSKSFPRS